MNKKTTILSLFIIIAMLTPMATLPSAFGHDPPLQCKSYAYINVAPNPAGLGQTVTIGFWLGMPPPTASNVFGDHWSNMTVKVTKPNGQTETLGPFIADDTGGTFTVYTPDQLGNYTFQMHFPGQTIIDANPVPNEAAAITAWKGDYFLPADSPVASLTVQRDPIPMFPETPLPNQYWTRPIESVNNYWYQLGGNWLGLGGSTFSNTGMYNDTGNYNPYTLAPHTSHIMWTKSVAFGGQIGGEFGGDQTTNFYSTSQYEPKYDPVIIHGILFYEMYPGSTQDPSGITAVDLRTGENIWTITDLNSTIPNPIQQPKGRGAVQGNGVISYTTTLRCGQTLDYESPNQYGALSYLWLQLAANAPTTANSGISYGMIDAMTGHYILTIANGTSMRLTEDAGGNLIGYYVNSTKGSMLINGQIVNFTQPMLCCWNSTFNVQFPNGKDPAYTDWRWEPIQGSTLDFKRGLMWAVPLPSDYKGTPLVAGLGISAIQSNTILMTSTSSPGLSFGYGWQIEAGYDQKTGQQLWITNRTQTPYSRVTIEGAGNGVYCEVCYETFVLEGYSLRDGTKLWTTPLPNPNPYDSIGGYMHVVANDTNYLWSFGGNIYAVNFADGKIRWTTNTNIISGDPGDNTPYGIWPLWTFTVGSVADGMLFVPEGHMYNPPLFHGAHQLAINVTDGSLVWQIMAHDVTSGPAISDGIMTTLSAYDNLIYAYGRGPSKTTVSAPQMGVTTATPITITGTVTDICAGASQNAQAMNFPNGLPCVSDESIEQFMEYAYMQQPQMYNTTGVTVKFSVLDSNNNFREIGQTTSDATGAYGFTWTPDIPGNFNLIASFPGSESYYPSSAQTYFHATLAQGPAPTTTPVTLASTQNSIMMSSIAIIVVIIIGFAVLSLIMLRKRA